MKRNIMKSIGKALWHYVIFFLLVSFVITSCTMLFMSIFSETVGIELTGENIGAAAKLTFINVAVISLIFTVIDYLRRRYTVHRPVKQITEAAEEMIRGNFGVRIKPLSKFATDDGFGEIIKCINKMAEELSGVETLRDDFVSGVSHEMKTPLSVIQNYGTLLQSHDLSDEKRQEYATAINEACRRLSSMITNILKLNRLENQQIYPKPAEYNLSEQLCECVLEYENVWESKGIEIEMDIDDGVYLCADGELLALVWSNLLSNAFKFTASGGSVSVSLKSDGRCAIVSVQDTGCGISAEMGKHIFEKFYQGDPSRATQGNGLGLALVKRVVDIVNGEIGVESVEGEGSTFTVKLECNINGLEENR